MRTRGLENSLITSSERFCEATSDLRVIALGDENACRSVTQKELQSFDKLWSVDSRLVQNLEGVCGILGIDEPMTKIIARLGKTIHPAIPSPRILGSSKSPFIAREVAKIYIYPEKRSHRIDICWEKEKPGRWVAVPHDLLDRIIEPYRYEGMGRIWSIFITGDAEISSECPEYDLVIWRKQCFILSTSPINDLLDILGMNGHFADSLGLLLHFGKIPAENRPTIRQHLADAKGQEGEDLLDRLVQPFERRFGDVYRAGEGGQHMFLGGW